MLSSRSLMVYGLLCLFTMPVSTLNAASLEQSLKTQQTTQRLGKSNQQTVDRLSNQTQDLMHEYQRLLQQADYQQSYNLELKQRLQEQEAEIAQLKQEISDVQITRLHILPLLREMVSGLKQFVQLDLPFEQAARLDSITRLEALLANSTTPITEKFRRVMEAYQTESDYSYNLGYYRDTVTRDDNTVTVEFLRIGRTSLYYQTLDGKHSAYWQASSKQWLPLDEAYNAVIRKGLRIANQQSTPALLPLPVISQVVDTAADKVEGQP